jgi:hypothetical protein
MSAFGECVIAFGAMSAFGMDPVNAKHVRSGEVCRVLVRDTSAEPHEAPASCHVRRIGPVWSATRGRAGSLCGIHARRDVDRARASGSRLCTNRCTFIRAACLIDGAGVAHCAGSRRVSEAETCSVLAVWCSVRACGALWDQKVPGSNPGAPIGVVENELLIQ